MGSAGRLTGELLARKGGASPTYPKTTDTVHENTHAVPRPEVQINRRRLKAVVNDEPQPDLVATPVLNGFSKRVAMTLRLDEDRHLKLRLLAALKGRSCQSLLIDALDHLIDDQADALDSQMWQRLQIKK